MIQTALGIAQGTATSALEIAKFAFSFGDYNEQLRRLRADPLYNPVGVRIGRGRPVVTLPGVIGGDRYMRPSRDAFDRNGYRAFGSDTWANVGCPNEKFRRLKQQIVEISDQTGFRVALIPHSLGALIAKALAVAIPERVSCLCSIAGVVNASPLDLNEWHLKLYDTYLSPFRRIMGRTLPNCSANGCACELRALVSQAIPEEVRTVLIRVKDDHVVFPGSSTIPGMECREVSTTHFGSVNCPEVLRIIIDELQRASWDLGEQPSARMPALQLERGYERQAS